MIKYNKKQIKTIEIGCGFGKLTKELEKKVSVHQRYISTAILNKKKF